MAKKKTFSAELALIPTNTEAEKKIAQEQVRGLENMMGVAAAGPLRSDIAYETAGDTLQKIATVRKNVESHRMKVSRAITNVKKLAEGPFKAMLEKLDGWRSIIEDQMDAWETLKEEEAERERERERIKAEAQAKRLQTLADKKIENAKSRDEILDIKAGLRESVDSALATGEAKEAMVDDGATKLDGIGSTEMWDFEVENIKAVPREWLRCEPKRREILQWANTILDVDEGTVIPEIPGLKFFRTKRRSVRSF